jgi:prophage regulatory protein
MHASHETRYLRLSQIVGRPATAASPAILGIIPVSRSTWWNWAKSGKVPQPIRLSSGVTVWRTDDVLAFAESMAGGAA